jgi:hypothetical protein
MCRNIFIKPLTHELLKNVESKIKEIVGIDIYSFTRKHTKYDEKYEKIKELLNARQSLLDNIFFATPEEIKRLEQVNSLLDDLTKKMFHRTASLYRALLSSYRDEEFDDDYEIEGTLKCNVDYDSEDGSYGTVLKLENDEFYGSDFGYMIALINEMQDRENIVECHIGYKETHTLSMSNEELDCYDYWDDGISWNEGQQNRNELENICICYAMHIICVHNEYSLLDLLRLNDFWVEVQITCQHIVSQ